MILPTVIKYSRTVWLERNNVICGERILRHTRFIYYLKVCNRIIGKL